MAFITVQKQLNLNFTVMFYEKLRDIKNTERR